MKVSVFIACSLDGYIARADGAIDWLPSGEEAHPEAGSAGEDYGYRDFMDSVDVLVMGRVSFEKVLTFGKWPYGGKPVVVLSRERPAIPAGILDTVSWLFPDPGRVIDTLAARGARHLYVDGGKTIQGFLAAGLIDTFIITRLPILIGGGLPLFGTLTKDLCLQHIETRVFDSGFVQSRYAARRSPPGLLEKSP